MEVGKINFSHPVQVLIYPMKDSYDMEQAKLTLKAPDLWFALTDIGDYLRVEMKYKDGETFSKEEVWDRFWEILNDRDITLNELS